MRKEKIQKLVGVSSTGETMALTAEQIAICSDVSLWEKTNEELKKLMVETQDASTEYKCLDILSYRKSHAQVSEIEKVLSDVAQGIVPVGNALESAISNLGNKIALVLLLQNEERKSKGLETKDSISFGLLSSKVFSVRRAGYPETFVTLTGDVTAKLGAGKKAIKAINRDAAWRLAMAKDAARKQAEIDRKWNEYEQNEVENADRW